jgi:hypothetical protein
MSSVLVVHRDRKSQRMLARVVTSGVGPVTVVDSIAAAREHVAPATIAVVSAELAGTRGFPDLVAALRAAGGDVVLCGEAGPTPILCLVRDHAIDHIITSDPIGYADELPLTLRGMRRCPALGAPCAERYLTHGAQLVELTPETTHGRHTVLASVRDGLAAMSLSARHERQAALIADELLANAIYDAPCGGGEVQRESPREADRALADRERPRLRWGGDGRFLAIEVTDTYGTLDAATIRHYISKLVDRSNGPRQGSGGAGLGLAMTFLAASQLLFHIVPGHTTRAIGLIDLRIRTDGLRALVPSLHVYVAPPAAAEEEHG